MRKFCLTKSVGVTIGGRDVGMKEKITNYVVDGAENVFGFSIFLGRVKA